MTARSLVLCLVNIYLLLSVHPIQAARIKAAQHAMDLGSTQDLVTALEKSLNEHRMEDWVSANSSTEYIGETWASCAQRKDDFERRSAKFEELYQEAKKDDTVNMVESGWMILKARSLSATLSASQKQGCDWVKSPKDKGGVDLGHLESVIQDGRGDVPCIAEAGASFHNKTDISERDLVNAFGILLSKDCKPQTVEPLGDLGKEMGMEEAEENAEETVAAELAAKLGSPASLLQASRLMQGVHHSSDDAMKGWIVVYIIIAIFLTMVCMMVGFFLLAVLGIIFCLLKTFMLRILKVLRGFGEEPDFYGCGKTWLGAREVGLASASGKDKANDSEFVMDMPHVCAAGAIVVAFPLTVSLAPR